MKAMNGGSEKSAMKIKYFKAGRAIGKIPLRFKKYPSLGSRNIQQSNSALSNKLETL